MTSFVLVDTQSVRRTSLAQVGQSGVKLVKTSPVSLISSTVVWRDRAWSHEGTALTVARAVSSISIHRILDKVDIILCQKESKMGLCDILLLEDCESFPNHRDLAVIQKGGCRSDPTRVGLKSIPSPLPFRPRRTRGIIGFRLMFPMPSNPIRCHITEISSSHRAVIAQELRDKKTHVEAFMASQEQDVRAEAARRRTAGQVSTIYATSGSLGVESIGSPVLTKRPNIRNPYMFPLPPLHGSHINGPNESLISDIQLIEALRGSFPRSSHGSVYSLRPMSHILESNNRFLEIT